MALSGSGAFLHSPPQRMRTFGRRNPLAPPPLRGGSCSSLGLQSPRANASGLKQRANQPMPEENAKTNRDWTPNHGNSIQNPGSIVKHNAPKDASGANHFIASSTRGEFIMSCPNACICKFDPPFPGPQK